VGLELRILGPVEVVVGGEPRRLGGRKQRSLLALLGVHAGEVVSSDRIIEALWPAYDPAARKRLQVYVSQLRKALGPAGAAVEWRSEGYVLAVEADAVDAGRFAALAAAGAEAMRAGEHERAARTLREALDLWRGPALDDLASEPFAQIAGARLEELRVAALEDRIDADLALGSARSRCASACAGSSCSRCIAAAARPTRSRRSSPPGACCSTSSGSSPAPSCDACSRRSSTTTRRCSSSGPRCAPGATCRRQRRR
jgi:DNA-binding SARP family transcriptional activator